VSTDKEAWQLLLDVSAQLDETLSRHVSNDTTDPEPNEQQRVNRNQEFHRVAVEALASLGSLKYSSLGKAARDEYFDLYARALRWQVLFEPALQKMHDAWRKKDGTNLTMDETADVIADILLTKMRQDSLLVDVMPRAVH
jgi:hypothetical protein